MKQIWKYPLSTTDTQVILMPEGAKVLCVQIQNNVPCIWAEVNPKYPVEQRGFHLIGTGHEMSDEDQLRYIGTFQFNIYVFHLYEPNYNYQTINRAMQTEVDELKKFYDGK